MKKPLYLLPLVMALFACNSSEKASQTQGSLATADSSIAVSAFEVTLSYSASPMTSQAPTMDDKIQLNWQKIDSGEPAIDKQQFAYKFAPDSIPVQNYVKAYNVDNLTAQYNLTIGMGANEPLDKVLDQIGTNYVSHELTAGDDSKLVIHTTPKVAASQHKYILSEPFAKGLTLNVQIIPDGKKS